MKYKAIIFDVGGVLQLGKYSKHQIDNHKTLGVHQYISKKLNVTLDQYFDSIDKSYTLSIEGKISEKKAIQTIAKNLKTTPSKIRKLYIKDYKKNFKKNKQLFKQAFKLKKLGYKIAILSDQWYLSKEALMPKKIFNKFDNVIVSCDVGIRKPNSKIYRLTLKKLKIKPSESLFIDNQKWNTDAAKKLGINIILFKNNKQLFENKIWKSLWK